MKKNLHFLTGEELGVDDMQQLLQEASHLKKQRESKHLNHSLAGKHLALLFDKPSLRTRFSFTIAMRELGGDVVESVSSARKTETPEDQARVLQGYCHGIMVRTHEDSLLERMAKVDVVPIINGLSNLHHPCQILSDLFTLAEVFGDLSGITLAYVGDGNNILHSLLLMAPALGVNVHYACPQERSPDADILARAQERVKSGVNQGRIQAFSQPLQAIENADAVYTDVWTSMGFEEKSAEHLFAGYQVNAELMRAAKKHAKFMHCLPMERGKEVSETLPDQACSVIFQQSENRLHAQKALLLFLMSDGMAGY
jgi:ornithine carbamoyltransferase